MSLSKENQARNSFSTTFEGGIKSMSQPQQNQKDKPTRPMRGGFMEWVTLKKAQDFKGTYEKAFNTSNHI